MAEPSSNSGPSAAVAALLGLLEGQRAAGRWVPDEYAAFRAWHEAEVGPLPSPAVDAAPADEGEEDQDVGAIGGASWQSLLAALQPADPDDDDDLLD